MVKDMNHEKVIAEYLAEFFKDNPEKIAYWLMLKNPQFGNWSPCELIAIGRIDKVAKFVKSAKFLNGDEK